MSKYIFQLRRGWKWDKNPNTGLPQDDWATYEETKYIQTKGYNPTFTYYLDKVGTIASPQPTKSSVENGNYYIENPNYVAPLAGELVLEYDNGVPRLKIGNGVDDFSKLEYMSVDSFILPKPTSVTVYADKWIQATDDMGNPIANRYYQEVTVVNATITPNSKVDLQIEPADLIVFREKDITFTTVNEDGKVRVCLVGQEPMNDYTMQATVTEVIANG